MKKQKTSQQKILANIHVHVWTGSVNTLVRECKTMAAKMKTLWMNCRMNLYQKQKRRRTPKVRQHFALVSLKECLVKGTSLWLNVFPFLNLIVTNVSTVISLKIIYMYIYVCIYMCIYIYVYIKKLGI